MASVGILAGTEECFLLYFLLGKVLPHLPPLQMMEDENCSYYNSVFALEKVLGHLEDAY